MTKREFLKTYRKEIDAMIQSAGPGSSINDAERELWIENDEYWYHQARRHGVRI